MSCLPELPLLGARSTDKMRPSKVSTYCLCLASLVLLSTAPTAVAEDDSVGEAIQVLSKTKAMAFPEIEMKSPDPKKAEAARELFATQLKALRKLTGERNPSLVQVLIPYIYYTDDYSFESHLIPTSKTKVPELKTWAFHWPAFAVIAMTPGSGRILAKYVLDTKNDAGYRMHAFDVLGTMYPGVSSIEDAQTPETVAMESPAARSLLTRIENGDVKPYPPINSNSIGK
jgi:hypothetical protein